MKISAAITLTFAALLCIFFANPAKAFQPTTYVINFGGSTLGHHYSPSKITVEVGDTIIWKGDFSVDNMDTLVFPANAPTFGPVTSGLSFSYTVQTPGVYFFGNKIYLQLGMSGTITGEFRSHGSLTNEGREFYLGMIYPNYEKTISASLQKNFHIFALIATYYPDTLYVSYFDDKGIETTPTKYTIPAHNQAQIELDVTKLRMDSLAEVGNIYRSCHIVSTQPVTIHYLSRGCNSGGSYLALPVMGLGKKYVVASYYDNGNPPGGALYGNNGLPSLSTRDISGGTALIIASEDATSVNIMPSTPTSGGHPRGQYFSVSLSRGQSYIIRSNGQDAAHDLTGTIIQATKPVVVISGHEDGYLGDISCATQEGRDLMIEQMTPVEYWDTTGFIGIPIVEGNKGNQTCGGNGDSYRVMTFDPGSAIVHASVGGVPGGYEMNTSALNYSEKLDITGGTEIYSTNGHKINVMQYDERTHPQNRPEPTPSMMTVVPHSRWRTSYNFAELNPTTGGIGGTFEGQYVGVIADSMITVKVSGDGSADSPVITAFSSVKTYYNLSTNYPSTGQVFSLNASKTYFVHSNYPFMVYLFGMNTINNNFGMTSSNYQYEYATPAGMQLNTGVTPSFKVSVTDLPDCQGWNVCVTDVNANNPGVKVVILVNDSEGVYFQRPGAKFQNARLDPSDKGYTMYSERFVDSSKAELHPNWASSEPFCFKVLRPNVLKETKAPLCIIDNNGNGLLVQLYKSAPTVKLTSDAAKKPDSIYFPVQTVGSHICTTFVVTNTAPKGGSSLLFTEAKLKINDGSYKIESVAPALPASLKPSETLTLQVCYTSKDAKRHFDSLIISTDCFNLPISLDAHGAVGTIDAANVVFGNIDSGKESCNNTVLTIRNTGTADFKLLPSPTLSDNVNFAIDPAFLASLPMTVKAGSRTAYIKVCYHPQHSGKDSATINWVTDIDAAFAGSGKPYTALTGTGLAVHNNGGVKSDFSENTFSVRPNPAPGNSAIVSFSLPSKRNASVAVLDVLGRELYTQRYAIGTGEFEIPIGNLSQGIYYVRLTSEDIVLTQKLEVTR